MILVGGHQQLVRRSNPERAEPEPENHHGEHPDGNRRDDASVHQPSTCWTSLWVILLLVMTTLLFGYVLWALSRPSEPASDYEWIPAVIRW